MLSRYSRDFSELFKMEKNMPEEPGEPSAQVESSKDYLEQLKNTSNGNSEVESSNNIFHPNKAKLFQLFQIKRESSEEDISSRAIQHLEIIGNISEHRAMDEQQMIQRVRDNEDKLDRRRSDKKVLRKDKRRFSRPTEEVITEAMMKKVRNALENSLFNKVRGLNSESLEKYLDFVGQNYGLDPGDWSRLETQAREKILTGPRLKISSVLIQTHTDKLKRKQLRLDIYFMESPSTKISTQFQENDSNVVFNNPGALATPGFQDPLLRIDVIKYFKKSSVGEKLIGTGEISLSLIVSNQPAYLLLEDRAQGKINSTLHGSNNLKGSIKITASLEMMEPHPNQSIPQAVQQILLHKLVELIPSCPLEVNTLKDKGVSDSCEGVAEYIVEINEAPGSTGSGSWIYLKQDIEPTATPDTPTLYCLLTDRVEFFSTSSTPLVQQVGGRTPKKISLGDLISGYNKPEEKRYLDLRDLGDREPIEIELDSMRWRVNLLLSSPDLLTEEELRRFYKEILIGETSSSPVSSSSSSYSCASQTSDVNITTSTHLTPTRTSLTEPSSSTCTSDWSGTLSTSTRTLLRILEEFAEKKADPEGGDMLKQSIALAYLEAYNRNGFSQAHLTEHIVQLTARGVVTHRAVKQYISKSLELVQDLRTHSREEIGLVLENLAIIDSWTCIKTKIQESLERNTAEMLEFWLEESAAELNLSWGSNRSSSQSLPEGTSISSHQDLPEGPNSSSEHDLPEDFNRSSNQDLPEDSNRSSNQDLPEDSNRSSNQDNQERHLRRRVKNIFTGPAGPRTRDTEKLADRRKKTEQITILTKLLNEYIYPDVYKVGMEYMRIFAPVDINFRGTVGQEYIKITTELISSNLWSSEELNEFLNSDVEFNDESTEVQYLQQAYNCYSVLQRVCTLVDPASNLPAQIFKDYSQAWLNMGIKKAKLQLTRLISHAKKDEVDDPRGAKPSLSRRVSEDDPIILQLTVFLGISESCWKLWEDLTYPDTDKELECCLLLIDGLNNLEKIFINEKEKFYLDDEVLDVRELVKFVRLLDGLKARYKLAGEKLDEIFQRLKEESMREEVVQRFSQAYPKLNEMRSELDQEIIQKMKIYANGHRAVIQSCIKEKKENKLIGDDSVCVYLDREIQKIHKHFQKSKIEYKLEIEKSYSRKASAILWNLFETDLLEFYEKKKRRNLEKNKPSRFDYLRAGLEELLVCRDSLLHNQKMEEMDTSAVSRMSEELCTLGQSTASLIEEFLRQKEQQEVEDENQQGAAIVNYHLGYIKKEDKLVLEIRSIQNLRIEGRERMHLEFRTTYFPPRAGEVLRRVEKKEYTIDQTSWVFDVCDKDENTNRLVFLYPLYILPEIKDCFICVDLLDKVHPLKPAILIGDAVFRVCKDGQILADIPEFCSLEEFYSHSYSYRRSMGREGTQLYQSNQFIQLRERKDDLAKSFNKWQKKERIQN